MRSENDMHINSHKGNFEFNGIKVSKFLQENRSLFSSIFENDNTVICREICYDGEKEPQCLVYFIDGMVDSEILAETIIRPILIAKPKGSDAASIISKGTIYTNETTLTSEISKAVESVMYGDTVIFSESCGEAVVVNTKGFTRRGVEEPSSEKALSGSKEGFCESIITNLSLIRRRLQTCDLKYEFMKLGTRSNTKICICYLKSLTDSRVLAELKKRLNRIDIDSVSDSNFISEQIKENKLSPFKTVGTTERPDILASKLTEGRIALVIDGTPSCIYVPFFFSEIFQTADDNYISFYLASFNRILRLLCFFMSVSIPALYIAFVNYHWEIIPPQLAMSIEIATRSVPLPTVLECILMLFTFEIIKEGGIRAFEGAGQALGIVGALVVGQAAVEAKLISAPMLIVVGASAIADLVNPKIRAASILARLFLLVSSSLLGLYGYVFAAVLILLHLLSLKTFSFGYTDGMFLRPSSEIGDSIIRKPLYTTLLRPAFVWWNKTRSKGAVKK